MGFIVSIKTDLKFTTARQHQKFSSRYKTWGVIRGLEIYDGPNILNCSLYFVTTSDVSQQMSISVGGGATKSYF